MKLPIVVGRNSLGENHTIDLTILPHLFISYQEDFHLRTFFSNTLKSLLDNHHSLQLALSLGSKISKELLPLIDRNKIVIQFVHSNTTDDQITNIDQFIKHLTVELKNRRQSKKKKPSRTFQPLVVFIDDIFEVIRSPNRKTALEFIQLLATGAEQSIYFVAGFSGIYKPLLNQLIHLHPATISKFNKSNEQSNLFKPLAAELVINPDGLIFFTGRDEHVFTRLFPQ